MFSVIHTLSRYFMLKILHLVSYSLWSGPLPGVVGLAKAQRAMGHKVYVAYDRKRGAFNPYEEAADPYMQEEDMVPLTLSAKSSLWELWCDIVKLRAWVKREKPDVVHVHLSHDHMLAACALVGLNVCLVRTVHSVRSYGHRVGQDALMSSVSGVFVRSEESRKRCVKRYRWMDERKVRVLEGGIDSGWFRPLSEEARDAVRKAWGVGPDVCVLGHVALMVGRGQEELIDACAVLPEDVPLRVVLVGRGEREAALKKRIAEKGLGSRVCMLGYQQGMDLVRTYAGLDAAFVAQAGNDGAVRALLEAMACEKPVLAVGCDGLDSWVGEDRGYVTSREPSALAEAMLRVLQDHTRAEKGVLARRYVEKARSFEKEAQDAVDGYEFYRKRLFVP